MWSVRAGIAALLFSTLAGCICFVSRKACRPVGLHETARDEGWTMEVCQLAGRKGGAHEFVQLPDGHTVLASYGSHVWIASLTDLIGAGFGPPHETPPIAAWQVVHDDAIRIFEMSTGKQRLSLWVSDEEHGAFSSRGGWQRGGVGRGRPQRTMAWDIATGDKVDAITAQLAKPPLENLPVWVAQMGAAGDSMRGALASPDGRWVYVPSGRGFEIRDGKTGDVAGRVRTDATTLSGARWLADGSGLDFPNSPRNGKWCV